jgi:hypothetical protein
MVTLYEGQKMPAKEKKKKRISVRAPDYIPKREPILKDTTGTEALSVFKMAKNVNRFFSFAVIAAGIFIIIISAYSSLSSINMFVNPIFMAVLGFVGAINILSGLLLLSKK